MKLRHLFSLLAGTVLLIGIGIPVATGYLAKHFVLERYEQLLLENQDIKEAFQLEFRQGYLNSTVVVTIDPTRLPDYTGLYQDTMRYESKVMHGPIFKTWEIALESGQLFINDLHIANVNTSYFMSYAKYNIFAPANQYTIGKGKEQVVYRWDAFKGSSEYQYEDEQLAVSFSIPRFELTQDGDSFQLSHIGINSTSEYRVHEEAVKHEITINHVAISIKEDDNPVSLQDLEINTNHKKQNKIIDAQLKLKVAQIQYALNDYGSIDFNLELSRFSQEFLELLTDFAPKPTKPESYATMQAKNLKTFQAGLAHEPSVLLNYNQQLNLKSQTKATTPIELRYMGRFLNNNPPTAMPPAAMLLLMQYTEHKVDGVMPRSYFKEMMDFFAKDDKEAAMQIQTYYKMGLEQKILRVDGDKLRLEWRFP